MAVSESLSSDKRLVSVVVHTDGDTALAARSRADGCARGAGRSARAEIAQRLAERAVPHTAAAAAPVGTRAAPVRHSSGKQPVATHNKQRCTQRLGCLIQHCACDLAFRLCVDYIIGPAVDNNRSILHYHTRTFRS